jgi:hypothetical protein
MGLPFSCPRLRIAAKLYPFGTPRVENLSEGFASKSLWAVLVEKL